MGKTDHVIDDAEHTDPDQPDIGKPLDLSGEEVPADEYLDVGDLDDLVDAVDPHVKGDD